MNSLNKTDQDVSALSDCCIHVYIGSSTTYIQNILVKQTTAVGFYLSTYVIITLYVQAKKLHSVIMLSYHIVVYH